MNEIISLFIDNQMSLNDKIDFVENVRSDQSFAAETLELLHFEKQIRSDVVEAVPQHTFLRENIFNRAANFFMQPLGWVSTALAAAVIALVVTAALFPEPASIPKSRFVIYKPDVNQVEIAGSFTNWKRIPMQRVGNSGYWEINMVLPKGEHHYTYILEGRHQFADPTVRTRERDDFGGFNSILYVDGKV